MQSADLCPFIQFSLQWWGLYKTLQRPPDQSIQSSPSLQEIELILESTFAIIYSSPLEMTLHRYRGQANIAALLLFLMVPRLQYLKSSQVNRITLSFSPFLYLFRHPTGIHVQMGHLGRGFAWPRSLEGQAFHHLLMQSFPPALATPGVRAPLLTHPSPGHGCRWRRQMLLTEYTEAKSSSYGNQSMFCIFK